MITLAHDHMLPTLDGRRNGRVTIDGCTNCTVSSAGLMEATASDAELSAMADGLIKDAGTFAPSMSDIAAAMGTLSLEDAQRLAQVLISKGVDAWRVQNALDSRRMGDPGSAGKYGTLWRVLATVSAAASGYHGYKRNDSIGWGIVWFALGGLFPVITPVIAVAQGYGKPK